MKEQILNQVVIPTGPNSAPIEIVLTGKLPAGVGKQLIEGALEKQSRHPEFIDEFNEPSAIIAKTNFTLNDPTAVYTFAVDTRNLVFHRHAGHRVIVAITGARGSILKFSLCSPEEANANPNAFLEKMVLVHIPADRVFVLRFSGTVYHQFCPADPSEKAFFAISVHTNEAAGLSGELLDKVIANEGTIPLLTEPASNEVMKLLEQPHDHQFARHIFLELEEPNHSPIRLQGAGGG